MEEATIAIDSGNGTMKIVVMNDKLIDSVYLPNNGVIETLKQALVKIKKDVKIIGCGITGASRRLLSHLIGADTIKTEILAHSIGILHYFPNARFAIDLGKEDSKLMEFKDGVLTDFKFNSICSAGCGSYLDNIAYRFGIDINDFADIALMSKRPANVSSKCAVLGTSAALSKLHSGVNKNDILMGVAYGLARNYLSILAKGKKIEEPVVFVGGVSKNKAVVKAFSDILKCKITTHPFGHLTGAIGMAILARKRVKYTKFKGFEISEHNFETLIRIGNGCSNMCEITDVYENNKKIGSIGNKCGRCI